MFKRKFRGLIALSNPRYSLYTERPDPAVQKNLTETDLRLGELQSYLPRHLNEDFSIYTIAEKFGLSVQVLSPHLRRFADKGLVELKPVPSLDFYGRGSSR